MARHRLAAAWLLPGVVGVLVLDALVLALSEGGAAPVIAAAGSVLAATLVLKHLANMGRLCPPALQTGAQTDTWQMLAQEAPTLIAVLSRQGEVLFINRTLPQTEAFLRARISTLLGMDVPEHERLRAVLKRVFESKETVRYESMLQMPEGQQVYFENRVGPIGLPGGVDGAMFIAVDITERKRAEDSLRAGEKSLRDLIDAIPSPVYFKDQTGLYRICNQAFGEFLGRGHPDLKGKSVFEIAPPEQAAVFHQADMELMRSGGSQRYETKVRHADGSDRDVVFYKSCVRADDGTVSGLVGVMLDVSDLKRMERDFIENQNTLVQAMEDLKKFNEELERAQEQLVQSEKLAAIGYLAAGVAHEINNPLGYIRGNMSAIEQYMTALREVVGAARGLQEALARGDADAVASARQRLEETEASRGIEDVLADIDNVLGETRGGIERIKGIVTDLKRFSRSDSGAQVPANVNDVIDGVVNIAWNELKYKAELVKDYGENIPLVLCNVQQLGQVVVNMLVNAGQAIEGHGTVTLKTAFCGGRVEIEVRDTGSGIPPEILPKIFDPFFTTKAPGKGTGLGLSISYDIIKKHQGTIEVDSGVGRGTVFRISLPSADPEATMRRTTAAPPAGHDNVHRFDAGVSPGVGAP